MKIKVFLSVLISLLFLWQGCETEKKEVKNEFYSNDTTQIAEQTVNFQLGIKFNPPKDWDLQKTEISKKIQNRSNYKGIRGEFIYEPSYVYFDKKTFSVLSLGRVLVPDSLKSMPTVMDLYSQIIAVKTKRADKFDVTQFAKGNIRFTRFLITQGKIKSVRLLFQNKFNDIIEFDYTTRTNKFSSQYEKIKQSIGSITLL